MLARTQPSETEKETEALRKKNESSLVNDLTIQEDNSSLENAIKKIPPQTRAFVEKEFKARFTRIINPPL